MATRKWLKLSMLIFSLAASQGAHASQTSSFQVVRGNQSGSFFGGLEFASLRTSANSLTGTGLQLGYRYILTHRWAADASLSQIYGSGSGSTASVLYTGINASLRYAPFVEFAQHRSAIIFEGRKIFEESSENNRPLAIGLQVNQLLLNGASAVYNATGLGAVLSYDLKAWGYRIRPEARYGTLVANGQNMTAIFGNLLLSF